MRYFSCVTDRLCVAALLASPLLASATVSCLADEPATKVEVPSGYEDAPEASDPPSGYEDAPEAKDPPSGYEDAPEAKDPPSGYEDAPEADGPESVPAQNLSKTNEFGKAAAILDTEVDPNLVNVEKAYLAQFQQLVNVERSFILRACQLDKKQRSRISEVSDRCAKIMARQYAIAQSGRMRGGMMLGGGMMVVQGGIMRPVAATQSDPRGEVGRLLLLAVDELLSTEQKKRYAEESQRRKDYFERTIVLNLVARIDRRLVLTDRQREQLIESLTKNWDPSWAGMLSRLLQSSNDYLPQIQDKHVLEFLDDKQRLLWQGIRKVGFGISGNFTIGQIPQPIDDKFAELKEIDENPGQGRPTN